HPGAGLHEGALEGHGRSGIREAAAFSAAAERTRARRAPLTAEWGYTKLSGRLSQAPAVSSQGRVRFRGRGNPLFSFQDNLIIRVCHRVKSGRIGRALAAPRELRGPC